MPEAPLRRRAERIVVTGGAGFIGHHLVRRLVAEGRQVTVLDDLSGGTRQGLGDAAFVRGDVCDMDLAASVLTGADAVVHLAAIASIERSRLEPLAAHRTNATGTLCVLEAARRTGVRGVVLAGSAAVYGPSEGAVSEDGPVAPTSLYGVDKLASEGYMTAYASLYGLGAVTLRFFNVYGPGQRPGGGDAPVVARWMAALAAKTPLELLGGGEQARDFVYVADVADAVCRAVDLAVAGGSAVANVGSGSATRLSALLADVAAVSGCRPEVVRRPARPGDVAYSCANIEVARSILGFAPRTALPVGLAETWRFWRSEAVRGAS